MKKLSFTMTGLCFALLITFAATAQTATVPSENLVSVTGHSGKTSIDNRIVSEFRKNFPNAVNESWMETKEGGIAVRFASSGIEQLVFLNKKGDCTGSIRYLTEKDLPTDVRHRVKSVYYDYTIKSVKEVTSNGIVAYLVTVDGETTWKIIRITDDDMDVFGAYTKG